MSFPLAVGLSLLESPVWPVVFLSRLFKTSLKWALPLFLIVCPLATAGEHPVRLAPDFDPAKCVDCHESQSKGQVVHAAVSTGCLSCHFVRNLPQGTRIVLKHTRIQTLCTSCHTDKKIAPSNDPVHPPEVGDCLRCHQPHVSENKGLLIKATSGDKQSNLCLGCHDQGLKVPEQGSRHIVLDSGCDSCHVSHKRGEAGKRDTNYHLTKNAPALCLDCHDAADAQIVQAHSGQPFASADCLQCHDPHQSKSPKLMQANLHNPFEGKMCDTCHQAPQERKVVLTMADSKTLCAGCHEETATKIASAKVPHPGAMGDCTQCHDPHAGQSARFIKPDPVEACLSCHADQADARAKKRVLHDPAFRQSCSICHTPHGGEGEHLLRAGVDELCLSCHGTNARAVPASDGAGETILKKTVRLPAGYVGRSPHISLTPSRLGHPVPAHPVFGNDPRDATNKKTITCISCHDPHAGERKYMLVSKGGSTKELCAECHKEPK